ncbi:hypothetical protein HYV80_01135 [Candidatus Woesearchaeota archaeon]|nr:hypothetical protein [Candidatus Woesearchaeota archaeon]
MKYVHLVKLTVFSYETEDGKSILGSMLKFFPFNPEDGKVEIKKTNAEGFNEEKIEIFEAVLAKENSINKFLKAFLSKLDKEQKEKITDQIESRLDENLDFFLRFDKQTWIDDNRLLITDSGNCFHLKMSMAAFPKKREIALNLAKNLFS